MEKSQVKVAIRDAIRKAARSQGWTLADLANRLGVGVSTLHRWKSNESTTLDLTALVEIFKFAGGSMDQAFGLGEAEAAAEARTELGVPPAMRDYGTLQTLLGLSKALNGITMQMENTIEGSLFQGEAPRREIARRTAVEALASLRRERGEEEQVQRQPEVREA